jgi:DNA-binding NarL/FixJ family response regulator
MDQSSSVAESVRPHPLRTLNPRDVEVLRLLAAGRSTGQIAAALSVSSNTARTRIRRVGRKLDVSERSAAVRAAGDLGLVPIPRPRRPWSVEQTDGT